MSKKIEKNSSALPETDVITDASQLADTPSPASVAEIVPEKGEGEIVLEEDTQETSPVFEQFLTVWGTPARGRDLWEEWYGVLSEDGKEVLNNLAEASAETRSISLEEAQRRMAVEKFLMDRGGEAYAVEYLRQREAREIAAKKPLQPMTIKKKKR
jgi:hypothetical protein